jgi:DNA-binding transcriptional LysR family regulator
MHYTLHQLKIFHKIAEVGSITKAAEELHLTQPAVSIQLKKLQEQIEIPLTEVIGRKIHITDFGRKMAEVSAKIIDDMDLIQDTVNQYKGLLTGKVKFSSVSTGKYVLPYFLRSFMDHYPAVELEIEVTNRLNVLDSLENNSCDFALVSVLPENQDLNAIYFGQNVLQLVGSSSLKEAPKSPEDLKDKTLIFREYGSATRNAMENYLNEKGIRGYKRIVLQSNEAVKQAVNAGLGYSIMPLIGLKNELANGSIRRIPMEGLPLVTQWNLVYSKDKRLTPAAEKLIEEIENHRQEVVERHFRSYLD